MGLKARKSARTRASASSHSRALTAEGAIPWSRDVPLSALPSPAATAWRTPRVRSTLGCRPASGALRPTTDRASRPMSVLRSKEQALSTPAQSLIENDSVRYGGIAAIAVLLFIIAAIIIYKIYIWRKDRQLWKIFNEKQAFGLDQNP